MTKAIITTISDRLDPGYSRKSEFDLFFNSLPRGADLIVFTDNLNRSVPGARILQCPPMQKLILERWYYYYLFLCTAPYSHVLLTDSRDVYMQGDPFDFATDKVLLCGEGFTHAQNSWNMEDQAAAQRSRGLAQDFSAWPVVNGGIVLGPAAKVRELCLLMYTFVMHNTDHTDQAGLGILYNTYLRYSPDYALSDPGRDAFCITGQAVKQGALEPRFLDGAVRTAHGEPYRLFHQWERTTFADGIRHSYNSPHA